ALKQFTTDTSGEYSGVGVQVQQKGQYIIVLRAFPGTPAATTPYEGAPADAPRGLQPNDRILAVDGKSAVNQDINDVADVIKGKEGTRVHLTILRPGRSSEEEDRQLEFTITRAHIQVPLVEAHMLGGTDVGYITLAEFDSVSGEEFRRGLDGLREKGARAIVLDLRGNPGGLLDAASDVASNLLPPGVLAYVVHHGGRTETWNTRGHGDGLGMPLVVLVNPYTASAAEILAGAIQDYGAGVIVGEHTFGKAVVQQTYTYDDNTGVKLTVAQWLTPKKRTINKVGLTPDVLMKEPANAEIGTLEKDPQLQRALQIAQEKIGETPSVFAPLPSEGAPARGTSQ
ncbi:MAG: S41 family peptidase, partial [Dactylosporangium sp.]|nr:S41 family peptidase [Dactylosporangium sp.]